MDLRTLLAAVATTTLIACGGPTFEAGPFSVPEHSPAGTEVGVATGPDALTYRLVSGNTGAAFLLGAATGRLVVVAPAVLDFETTPSFTLTVEASTPDGATATREVAVQLTDVNEAPTLAAAILSVPIGATNGTAVGDLSASVSDPDSGQTFTFRVTDGSGENLFAIHSLTGVVTVTDAANLSGGPWTLTVEVLDSGSPPLGATANVILASANSPVAVEDGADGLTGSPMVLELLANDVLGDPAATVVGYGGGALGGTSTQHAAGAQAPLAGGNVQVDANGHVTLTPTQAGTFTFLYKVQNTVGSSDGQVTLRICPDLAVGATYVGAALPALCLVGGALGAEYTLSPVNLSSSASAAVSVIATGIVPVVGGPTPDRLPVEQTDGFESRLRRMERTEVRSRAPGFALAATGLRPRAAIVPGVPTVGSTMTLNVNSEDACGSASNRTGEVVAVSTRAILMVDQANPSGGFAAEDYAQFASDFDSLVHPTVTGAFGAPADVDTNSRVILFFTSAVNALTPSGSSSFVGGFFFARDLFLSGCAASNRGEMFYLLVPDPSGQINGNERSVEFVRGKIMATVAHEYEHLINASRRLHVNGVNELEDGWLDEGMAHISEELIFYAAAGLAPKGNIQLSDLFNLTTQAAFFRYAESNFSRYRSWLISPHASGLFQEDDDLATRGAAWAFLRYVVDRRVGTQNAFWAALVNSTTAGVPNLNAVLGTDVTPWMRDFVAATYSDDATGGVAAVYTQPSWNFRSVYSGLNYGEPLEYPLAPRNPSNGVEDSFLLASGGGAAFLRVGVAAGQRATVTTAVGGSAPPATLLWSVFRRK